MQTPTLSPVEVPITRKLALDLIADAIADHILAQIARDQAAPVQPERKAQTASASKPKRAASKRKPLMPAPKK